MNGTKSKEQTRLIDESLTKPIIKGDDASKLQAWKMANSMISSWILNMIEPKLRTSIAHNDTPKAIWDTLKRRYDIAKIPKVDQLKTSIVNYRQGG